MITTDIFLWEDKDKIIGKLETESEVKGSRINDFGVKSATFFVEGLQDPLEWLLKAKFKIPGGIRPQTIWNFSEYEKVDTEEHSSIRIRGLIFKPDGLCIACSGTGKFKALTHRSEAKCPSCKGTGSIAVWEDTKEEAKDGTEGQAGTVVVQGKDDPESRHSEEKPLQQGT